MGLLGLLLIASVTAAAWTVAQHLQVASARLRFQAFEANFPLCQFHLYTVGGPAESLGQGITLAQSTLNQAGVTLQSAGDLASGEWLDALTPMDRWKARGDIAEVILLLARARVFLADRTPAGNSQQQTLATAIAWLNRAEQIDPSPTLTLYDDRASYREKLGDRVGAARDRLRAESIAPSTGRDYYLIGTSLLARAEPDRAEVALIKATSLNPQGFWSYFALGLCHMDQRRYNEAAGDFTVCSVLSPRFAWPWINRGLALARANRLVEARFAYDQAIAIDGTMADALANRGLVALELGDSAAAVIDLERAIDRGRRDIGTQAALGEALGRSGRTDDARQLLDQLIKHDATALLPRIARGTLLAPIDPAAAARDFEAILRIEPRHSGANLGLARLKRTQNPREALRLTKLAREANPNLIDAIELSALLRGRLGEVEVLQDVAVLARNPTSHRLYNGACSLALYHRSHPDNQLANQALELLGRALQLDFPASQIQADPDLVSLHSHPGFQELLKPKPKPRPPTSDRRDRRLLGP